MMLFIFYWCHHNSISGRERQSALIVYLIKFHLMEMMICNQRLNLQGCAKWNAAVTNSILECISWPSALVCWYVRHLSFSIMCWLMQHQEVRAWGTAWELIVWLLSFPLSAVGLFCSDATCNGAAGRQSLDCESMSTSHLRHVGRLVFDKASVAHLIFWENDSKCT